MLSRRLVVTVIGTFMLGALAAGAAWFGVATLGGGRDAGTALRAPRPLFPAMPYERAFYDEAFSWAERHPFVWPRDAAEAPSASDAPQVTAAIINHHLLARHLAARTLLAAGGQARRVVVLSPDHFSRGATDVTVATADFATTYGVVRGDDRLVNALTASGAATADNAATYREHGIQGIMPLIRRAFPEAEVTAAMIKPDATEASIDALVGVLVAEADDALFVASVDFSHNLSGPAAAFHDRTARAVLTAGDAAGAAFLEVDCRACIAALLKLTAQRQAQRFTLIDNVNSAALVEKDTTGETVSYVNGAFTAGAASADGVTTALLAPTVAQGEEALQAFVASLDPDREQRLFMGQHKVVQGEGGEFACPGSDVGQMNLPRALGLSGPIPTSARAEPCALAGSPGPATPAYQDFTCAGFPEPAPFALLGIVCEQDGSALAYPFFLERDHKVGFRLADQAQARVYLERYLPFILTGNFTVVP